MTGRQDNMVRLTVVVMLVVAGVRVGARPACSMEYVTVWDVVEQELVDKVVCETEFREICDQQTKEASEPETYKINSKRI